MPAAIRFLAAPDAPPAATYAQVAEVTGASRLLFISGQIPARMDQSVPETFEEQARLCWSNVFAQLRAGGMTLDNLVKVNIFLADRDHIDTYRRVRDEALGGRKIGLTTIVTGIFDTRWMLEIEAIAAA